MKTIKITLSKKHIHKLVNPLAHSGGTEFHPDYLLFFSILSILYANRHMSVTRIKMMSYFACFAIDGYYHACKGARELLCNRLDMNKSTYQKGMEELMGQKIITKLRNGSGSQYNYYKLEGIIQEVIQQEGNVNVLFSVK